ncbi:MAG: diguanylate cyclase [Fibrobacter sp.]|nr:diguanylate cyclase [Fibrobacter sp.]
MAKKSQKMSSDSISTIIGALLWLGQISGATYIWVSQSALPIENTLLLFMATLGAQIVFLYLLGIFILRDSVGEISLGAILGFSGSAFLFSSLNGLIVNSHNILFYLIPVLWIASNSSSRKVFFTALLTLFPEALQWLNAYFGFLSPIPPVVGVADPRLFDWSGFVLSYGLTALTVSLLGLLVVRSRFSSVVVSSNMPPPPVKSNAKIDAQSEAPSEEIEEKISLGVSFNAMDGAEAKTGLRGILESIVFFMSKNFKAHSALGFLSLDEGHTFVINARYSRSNYIKEDVLVYEGSGIVGKAIAQEQGFMTGNLKSYPDKIEYYSRQEEVNSVIITRIVEEDSKKVLGLLVVDSPSIRGFNDSDKDLLNRFSTVASKLISNALMRRVMETVAHQNEVVYETSKKLTEQNSVRGVMGVLIENLREVFNADNLIVCDYDSAKKQGRVIRAIGENPGVSENISFSIDDPLGIYAQVFHNKEETLEVDLRLGEKYRFVSNELRDNMPVELIAAPMLDVQGNVLLVLGLESYTGGAFSKSALVLLQTIMANASSSLGRARAYQRIKEQATVDGLTRIPNHRHFQDTLDKIIEISQREGREFALLLMDIDHFKQFNDTYGHPVGDRVLQVVAAAISKVVRPNTDFVARYGGEEFTVILNTSPAELRIAAERVRQAVEAQRIEHNGEDLHVTVSIGAATFPLDTDEKAKLIDYADQAMYHSKKAGRNRVSLWSNVKSLIE